MLDVGLLFSVVLSVAAITISVLSYREANKQTAQSKRLSDSAEKELKQHEEESKRGNVLFLLINKSNTQNR